MASENAQTTDERGPTTFVAIEWHPGTSRDTIDAFERTFRDGIANNWKRYGLMSVELDTR